MDIKKILKKIKETETPKVNNEFQITDCRLKIPKSEFRNLKLKNATDGHFLSD